MRRPRAGLALAAAAALALPCAPAGAATRRAAAAATRPAAASRPSAARPDAALYAEAQAAETQLRGSRKRMAQKGEWEAVVLRYRKVVARYPRCGYCDNALLAAGDALPRDGGRASSRTHYRDDALTAYRTLVMEYPSSSLGDDALWFAVEVARQGGDRRKLVETARAYLETYPEGSRAAKARTLLREREPASPLPKAPPPGLARVFDLRSWSGDASTRVVVDVERKVEVQFGPRLRARTGCGWTSSARGCTPTSRGAPSPSATACWSRCASPRTATTPCAWCSTSRTSGSTRSSTSRTRRAS